jgi:hypothetical protein
MDIHNKIIAAFKPHIGKVITYTPDNTLPESRRSYSKFKIEERVLNYILYFDLDVINKQINATDDIWAPIADIYWGQGYHSVLYGNASGNMFVMNGEREYVEFDADGDAHVDQCVPEEGMQ